MTFKGNSMKTEYEIRNRIDLLISEMYEINDIGAGDLFTHMNNVKKSDTNYNELKTIFWILGEPLPRIVETLRKS